MFRARSLSRPLAMLILMVFAVAGCDTVDHDEMLRSEPLGATALRVVKADNAFGLDLFRTINQAHRDENVVASPLSVSMALGMLLNGADGDTRTAIQSTLDLADLSMGEVNQSFKDMAGLLQGLDNHIDLKIANSIWNEASFEVEDTFLQANRAYFDAAVQALDFHDPRSVDTINDWVSRKTGGMIPEIMDEIDPSDLMYLINALYFDAPWRVSFDAKLTAAGTFHNADGSTSTLPFMHREGALQAYFTDTLDVVHLPYGAHDSLFGMTLVVPHEDVALASVVDGLDTQTLAAWTAALRSTDVRLALPRFEIEDSRSLRDDLSALGMDVAFDPTRADFRGINPQALELGLYVTNVLHKTFVSVDENGTKAAAATSIGVGVVSLPPEVRVDRPFVFIIREVQTGTILFIGKVQSLS